VSDKEKTFDGAQILGEVTGLGKEAVMEQWELVKANHKRLEECEGPHDFQCEDPKSMRSKYVCSKCGGKISKTDWLWYERGLAHGQFLARDL